MPLPDDICPKPALRPEIPAPPHAQPIYLSSVYECETTDQADAILGGTQTGYVYLRDAHPNSDALADRCRQLHDARSAAVFSSGMGALAAALLAYTQAGDHLVASQHLYGRSLVLLRDEAARLGVACTVVDTCDPQAVCAALTPKTRLVVVETIGNPLLRVADIPALAEALRGSGALLLVDNTFATPILCRPLALGADLVLESLTKMMNGHSDVVLGALLGGSVPWERVPRVRSTYGWSASPFDCYLAHRGLMTLHLRIERMCGSALAAAQFLSQVSQVERVDYPGLASHSDHSLAARQFARRYGSLVAFHLAGGRPAADRFIQAARGIPFCPSLGEASTTLSHPESTSHRSLSPQARAALGITGGTIRLSLGLESTDHILALLRTALAAL